MALPDDGEMAVTRNMPTIGRTFQGFGNDGMIAQLKALADSHTRLTKLLRDRILFDLRHDIGKAERHRIISYLLIEADEAEKL